MTLVVKENQLKFAPCQSGASYHYRQIFYYLDGSKPICAECFQAMGLSLSRFLPEPQKQPLKNKRVRRIGVQTAHQKALLDLQQEVLSLLEQNPLSTKELFDICGHKKYNSPQNFVNFLRRLEEKNLVISDRYHVTSYLIFALPGNADLIRERIGQLPLQDLVFQHLAKFPGPQTPREIADSIGSRPSSVYSAARRLQKKGLILAESKPIPGKHGTYLLCSALSSKKYD